MCVCARMRACVNDNTSIYSLISFIGRKTPSRGDNMYSQPSFIDHDRVPIDSFLPLLIRMAHLKSNDIRISEITCAFRSITAQVHVFFHDWLINDNSILMINKSFGCAENRSIIENWIGKVSFEWYGVANSFTDLDSLKIRIYLLRGCERGYCAHSRGPQ